MVPRGPAARHDRPVVGDVLRVFRFRDHVADRARKIQDPERTIPRGVFIAGAVTTLVYIAGSASVLFAVPVSSLKELSGITDAVQLVARRVGLSGLGVLTGGLLALNALAGTASWTAGAARVPFAAGVDAAMPRAFARLHPRYRTPHVALIVQSLASIGDLPGQRVLHRRRPLDVDPGGLRHPRQPHDPDLLRPLPVPLRGAGPAAARYAALGADPRLRRDRDLAGADVHPAARARTR